MSWHKKWENDAVWYLSFLLNKIVNKRVSLSSIFLLCFVIKHWEMLAVICPQQVCAAVTLLIGMSSSCLGMTNSQVDDEGSRKVKEQLVITLAAGDSEVWIACSERMAQVEKVGWWVLHNLHEVVGKFRWLTLNIVPPKVLYVTH